MAISPFKLRLHCKDPNRPMNGPITSVLPRPAAPSNIRRPGMPALAPGMERYRVRGGGSTVVQVKAGDSFTVTDSEGATHRTQIAIEIRPWF